MTDIEQRHLADALLSAACQMLTATNPDDGLAAQMANWDELDRVEAARAFARHLPDRLRRKCLRAFASPQTTPETRRQCLEWGVLAQDRADVTAYVRKRFGLEVGE